MVVWFRSWRLNALGSMERAEVIAEYPKHYLVQYERWDDECSWTVTAKVRKSRCIEEGAKYKAPRPDEWTGR